MSGWRGAIWYGGRAGVAVLLRADDGGLWLSIDGSATEILPDSDLPVNALFRDAHIQVASAGSWLLSYSYARPLADDPIAVTVFGALKTPSITVGPFATYDILSEVINGAVSIKRSLSFTTGTSPSEDAVLNLDNIGVSASPALGEFGVDAEPATIIYVGAPDYALEGIIAEDIVHRVVNTSPTTSLRRRYEYLSHTYSGGIFTINVDFLDEFTGIQTPSGVGRLILQADTGTRRAVYRQYGLTGLTATRTTTDTIGDPGGVFFANLGPATLATAFGTSNSSDRTIRDESDAHALAEINGSTGIFQHVDNAGTITELSAVGYGSFGNYYFARYSHPTAWAIIPPDPLIDGENTATLLTLNIDLVADQVTITNTSTISFFMPTGSIAAEWSLLRFYLPALP